MSWKDSKGKDINVCTEWVDDKFIAMAVGYSITGLIVGVNFFLKIIILKLIQCLRHKTVSKETYHVMLFVFISTFGLVWRWLLSTWRR